MLQTNFLPTFQSNLLRWKWREQFSPKHPLGHLPEHSSSNSPHRENIKIPEFFLCIQDIDKYLFDIFLLSVTVRNVRGKSSNWIGEYP